MPSPRSLTLALPFLALIPHAAAWSRQDGGERSPKGFEPRFRIEGLATLLDVGLVDFDGDDRLDIYTVNHSRRQVFLRNLGQWRFEDRFLELGLHQDPRYPGLEGEAASVDPEPDTLEVYWSRKELVLACHGLESPEAYAGSLTLWGDYEALSVEGFEVEEARWSEGEAERSRISFRALGTGFLRFAPEHTSAPMQLAFEAPGSSRRVRIGRLGSPSSAMEFEFSLRDRHGHAWSDMDGDGDLDLFVARGGLSGKADRYPVELEDELFLQEDGRFVNRIGDRAWRKGSLRARKTLWYDADADGVLDLWISSLDAPLELRLRRGDDLVEAGEPWGLHLVRREGMIVGDFVGNERPEVVSGGAGGASLFSREGERYVEAQPIPLRGRVTCLLDRDFDADGRRDLLLLTRGDLWLGRSDGRSLVEVPSRPLGLPAGGLDAHWLDLENDGDLDLFVDPLGMHARNAQGQFRLHPATRPDRRSGGQSLFADLDGDGDLDWVFAARTPSSLSWDLVVYENTRQAGHWLAVRLHGPPGNREAIGAKVVLETAAGTQTQWVGQSENSHLCQGHYRLHYGLGGSPELERLTVVWPDGSRQVWEELEADRLHHLRQGATR